MMYEDSSPFDEALSKPFLAEPAKKKWSLLSSSTAASTVATMFSDYYGDDSLSSEDEDDDDDSASDASEYEAPTLDMLDRDDAEEEEEVIVFGNTQLQTELKPVDMDLALLQERHGSFTEVHGMMSQINEISKDLSAIVDAQQPDIENLQSLSIESMEHAQAGVRHLMRINQQRERKQRRTYLLLAVLMIVGAFWVFGARVEEGDDDAEISMTSP